MSAIVKVDEQGFYYVSINDKKKLCTKVESEIQANEIAEAYNEGYKDGIKIGHNDVINEMYGIISSFEL